VGAGFAGERVEREVGQDRMSARALWKHALLATLLHLVMVALWPLLRAGYAPAFRAMAQLAVNVIDPLPGPIEARFEPGSGGALAGDVVRMDTLVRLQHGDLQGSGSSSFGASSFFHAYVPTTVLLALFGATNARTWRTRRKSLAWALVLLHAFLAFRVVLAVYYAYSKSTIEGRPVLDLGPGSLRLLHLAWHFAWEEPLVNYLAPLVAFGLCMFETRSSVQARA
jgi:hypothetical protein